ncbi:cell wall-active antibiotics response protein LiaF [Caldibacillus debilis]|uniref:cell wall-active antibiotics response protein LiaF n=1 Tax=Caldibacillus debilis TaxID=301148 RepID=UPI000B55EB10|nr:cell wall-active antibiotics response protein LiaF [Caldibacillus debilis]MBY6272631.1 cell wall-active antibiotics response protein [Bacillaceae bacterium]OUM90004.1 MAG: hypothetical protein BAA03_01475 [Caldibacillus debilis]REJ29128.1 MAG: cell wall-active antibiotics response protein [Caldibacillus debilis]
MRKYWNVDQISGLILLAVAALVIELLFFDGGLLISLAAGLACLYFSKKQREAAAKKALFLIGCFILALTVVNMMTFRLFVLGVVGWVVYRYYQSKKHPQVIAPPFPEHPVPERKVLKRKPLFQNLLFGSQRTPREVYEWNDIHLLLGVGDVVIDLSNTFLPKDAVISIRGFVGNVQILVPYEVEFTIHHTAVFSQVQILDEIGERVINEAIEYETEAYGSATEKVKIFTSMIVGKVEVRRV